MVSELPKVKKGLQVGVDEMLLYTAVVFSQMDYLCSA
jgi:hypothetical protein